MSLPIIVIITSSRCSHCISMRGQDGSFKSDDASSTIPNNWAWNEKFFSALLRGGEKSGPAKFKVYEINYSTMNPNDAINEISEFSLGSNNHVKRTIYSNNNDFLNVTTIEGDKKSTNPSNMKFSEFASKSIPKDISNYILMYPSILYFSNSAWENSKSGKENLYGLIAGANVTYNNGKWGFDTASKPTRVDPVEFSSKISKGQISLNPEVVPVNNNSQIVTARAGCSAQNFQVLPM